MFLSYLSLIACVAGSSGRHCEGGCNVSVIGETEVRRGKIDGEAGFRGAENAECNAVKCDVLVLERPSVSGTVGTWIC
jgi:hypothetical protein